MALQLFEVERGFLHNNASIIAGVGAPAGTGSDGTAGIGSIYQDTSSGNLYIKKVAGTSPSNWTRLALGTELSAGISWREPVVAADLTSVVLPTGTAGSTITVDTVTVDNGERVLFGNISGGGGKNVYTYTKATGTFTEDVNAETAGDNIYVIGGSNAGKSYNYNSSGNWVLTNQTNLDEEGYLRSFVGKSGAGSVATAYSSTNYVADGDTLLTAVGKLDTRARTNTDSIANEITARTAAVLAVQNEVNAIETGAGLNSDGTYTASGTANYISAAATLKAADLLLDTQLKTTANAVDSLNTSFAIASTKLDRARTENKFLSVTASTAVDTVSVDSVAAIKWLVHIQGTSAGNASKKVVAEVVAVHDGTTTADATAADYSVYAKLKVGTINGLSISVDVNGAGMAQLMRLMISSTNAVDVRIAREVIEF